MISVAEVCMPTSPWRKSTASNLGQCVEVAADSARIYVRDTANRASATIACSPAAWAAFTAGLGHRPVAAGRDTLG